MAFIGLDKAIAEVFADQVRATFPGRLGYQDDNGNTYLRVEDSISDKPESYYFHARTGEQPMVGIATNTGLSPLEDKYLIYGMPIQLRKVGKNNFEIAGLDGVFAAEYISGVPLVQPINPVNYSNIVIGLLDENAPDANMKARVQGAWYGTTYVATQETADFSASPLDVDGNTIDLPSVTTAIYVLVQIDPLSGELSYKQGEAFSAGLGHFDAWQLEQSGTTGVLFPVPDSGKNLVGYIKLRNAQTEIKRVRDIWPAQQLLSSAKVDSNAESGLYLSWRF